MTHTHTHTRASELPRTSRLSRRWPPDVWHCRQSDKRGPPGAVIEGKAKRYKQEDGPEATQQYTAAQVRQHQHSGCLRRGHAPTPIMLQWQFVWAAAC